MKTIKVKYGTRKDILEYLKTTGKKYVDSEKEINDQLDLTEQIPLEKGCYNQSASEDFIIEDFRKEFHRLLIDDMDDVKKRRNLIDTWEMVVKMEREAEVREAAYIRYMLELKDQLDRGYKL